MHPSVRLWFLTLFILAPALAHAQTQIFPANGSPGGPIVIAVVADHYGPQEQETFTRDARNVFVHGLLADSDFASLASHVTVLAYFEPWTGPAESPSSKYGFEVEAGVTNCSIKWTPNTDALVDAIAADRNPLRTIVVGNYGYVFGCTSGQWSYVTAGAVGQPVMQHEFGHLLARLFDEYVLSANITVTHPTPIPASDNRNCSTQTAPHWGGPPTFTNDPGCDYFGLGVIRPTSSCRMGKFGSTFCAVCRGRIDEAIQFQVNPPVPPPPTDLPISGAGFFIQPPAAQQPRPPQPAPTPAPQQPPRTPQPILRVMITLNRTTNAATVGRITNSTGQYVPSYRRLGGSLVYEISDAGRLIDVGVVPSDTFQERTYRGATQKHGVEDTAAATVVIRVPNETIQRMAAPNRAVQIAFYRLDASVTDPLITPETFTALRNGKRAVQVSAIPAAELRRALQ
jgi:hypothetical protein